MSDKDEAPIQFEELQWGTRGPRIPQPKQTGWKYKYGTTGNSRPTLWGTIFSVVLGGIIIFSGVSLFIKAPEINKANSAFYFVAGLIFFLFIGGGFIGLPLYQFFYYQKNNSPKRRKDYK